MPAALNEVVTLGRTLKKRATDILVYFVCPTASNGPTKALDGQLDHLRGTALDFLNLATYITHTLLETGGFEPQLHNYMQKGGQQCNSPLS